MSILAIIAAAAFVTAGYFAYRAYRDNATVKFFVKGVKAVATVSAVSAAASATATQAQTAVDAVETAIQETVSSAVYVADVPATNYVIVTEDVTVEDDVVTDELPEALQRPAVVNMDSAI